MNFRVMAFIVAVLLTSTCEAATPVSVIETTYYEGVIAGQPVIFKLSFEGETVRGQYVYKKYMLPISVSGKVNGNKLELIESGSESLNPTMNLLVDNDSLSGEWVSHEKHHVYLHAQSKSYRNYLKRINWVSRAEEIELDITYLNDSRQKLVAHSFVDTPQVIFEDLNFDGYPDLRVPDFDSMANASYTYFEYSPTKRKFLKMSSPVKDLISPKVLYSKKIVKGLSKDGCCLYTVTLIGEDSVKVASFNYTTNIGKYSSTSRVDGSEVSFSLSKRDFVSEYMEASGF